MNATAVQETARGAGGVPRRRFRFPMFVTGAALLCAGLSAADLPADASGDRTTVMLVVGAPGTEEYRSNFVHQATLWQQACRQADCRPIVVGLDSANPTNDLDRLRGALEREPKTGPGEFWLVLIGHGTFDGKEARFNLRGPDVSASDLAQSLKPFRRPLAVIDCASASAPFLARLSATNRVIITATRSGNENNYARFGEYLSQAVNDPQADLDKDGQTSLLEAFLMASRRVAEFYKVEGRLATEHALLDDNGDGLGTPADWFRGVRAIKKARENTLVDGLFARQFCLVRSEAERQLQPEQRARRDALERAVFVLREKRGGMAEDEYYGKLEALLVELAAFYETAATGAPGPQAPR